MRGYCKVCQKEYSNIYQHQQTKKHKELAENSNKTEDNIEIVNDQEDMPDLGEPGAQVQEDTKIQIIDGEPKKEKSTISEIMEVAFSEQFAPITTSLLNAVVERLQGTHNPERKNITYTQGGQEIEDF